MSLFIPTDTFWRNREEKKKSRHNLRYSTFFPDLRTHSVQLIPAEAASKVRWSEYDIKSRLKLETVYLFTFFFLSRHALLSFGDLSYWYQDAL